MKMELSLFITGTERSGTTLLCRMLSIHPDIQVLNEVFSSNELDNILPQKQALRELLSSLKQKNIIIEKKMWGIKHPYLIHHLDTLVRQFPGSKVIITLRDGRAVGNSYIRVKWGIANIYYGAKRWKEEVALQKIFMEKHPERSYVLKYESLLINPETELKKICSFLGIKYDEEMLNYYKYPLPFKENKSNVNTKRPIDPKIMNKWRTQLSDFQINIFETIAGDTLEENGYELIGKQITISPILKLWFWFQQKIVGEMQIQYQWRIKGIIRRYLS